MGWYGRILCLGRKNLGCIRFAFQEEGSWPGQAGQDRSGCKPRWDGEVRPTGCAALCILEFRPEDENSIGNGNGNET